MGYDWGKDPTTVLFGGYAGSFDTERMLHWIYEAGGLDMQRQFRDDTEGVDLDSARASAPPRCSCTRASRSRRWPT